jgi:hypothetical protein
MSSRYQSAGCGHYVLTSQPEALAAPRSTKNFPALRTSKSGDRTKNDR